MRTGGAVYGQTTQAVVFLLCLHFWVYKYGWHYYTTVSISMPNMSEKSRSRVWVWGLLGVTSDESVDGGLLTKRPTSDIESFFRIIKQGIGNKK